MADNKKFVYTPKNPQDPKMPNLLDDWDPHFYTEEEIRYKQRERAKFALTDEQKKTIQELEATEEVIIQKAKKENKFKTSESKIPVLNTDKAINDERLKKQTKKTSKEQVKEDALKTKQLEEALKVKLAAEETLRKAKQLEEVARKKEAESKRILKLAEQKLKEERRLAKEIELAKRPHLRTKDLTGYLPKGFSSEFTNVETKVKINNPKKKNMPNLDEDFTAQYTNVDTIVKVNSKKRKKGKTVIVDEDAITKSFKTKEISKPTKSKTIEKQPKKSKQPKQKIEEVNQFWFDDTEETLSQTQINELKKFKYQPKNPYDPKMPNLKDNWNPTYYKEEAPREDDLEYTIDLNVEPTSLETIEDNSTKELVSEYDPKVRVLEQQDYQQQESESRFITDVYDVIGGNPYDENTYDPKRPALRKTLELNIVDQFKPEESKFSLNSSNVQTSSEFSSLYNDLNESELSDEEIELAKLEAVQNELDKVFDDNDEKMVNYDENQESVQEAVTGELLPNLKNRNSKVFNMLQSAMHEDDQVLPSKVEPKTNLTILENRNSQGFLMPDPNYKHKISSYRDLYSRNTSDFSNMRRMPPAIGAINSEIKKSGNDVRRDLTENETKIIIDAFKEKVIKVTSKEVLIKEKKYGYEIYFNLNDQRWWTVAQTFPEPYIPTPYKQIVHSTLWSGASFIGHGATTLKETIANTKQMFESGRTGNVVIKEYLVDYDQKNKRIYTSNFPVNLTLDQYKKFASWYKSNKIEIFLKTYGKQDAEDLEKQAYENKKRGIKDVSAMLGGKLADNPRRANHIFAYPVQIPKAPKVDLQKPENKMYQVAFGVTD